VSYDFNVYVRRERLPSVAELQARLRAAGDRVELGQIVDLTATSGFVPVLLDGKTTGFELYPRPIDDVQRQDYRGILADNHAAPDQFLQILEACDLDIAFHCRASNRDEVTAARIVASAVAAAAHGWFTDPQTAETIRYALP
jgi:hypothetical protein